MVSLARWCFRHRRLVLAAWLLTLIVVFGLSRSVGSNYSNNFSFPSTDSTKALHILQANFPAQAGDSDQIVVQSKVGTLHDPATEATVTAMLGRVASLPHVRAVTSPYQNNLIGAGGTIGLATVNFDAQAKNLDKPTVDRVIHTAQSIDSGSLKVQLGGQAIEEGQQSKQSKSEGLGVILALVVLFFAFRRSILCAILPLISALVAIGIGTSLIGILTHTFSIPEFGPILATLIALGVGVDYALFIVSRHRNGLLAGQSVEDAVITSLNTSGRAVFFAGLTVCIALLGMFALQVSFLYGVAISAALVVVLTMLASLTLLPAVLGFFGLKVLRRAERAQLQQAPQPEGVQGFWLRWAQTIQRSSTWTSLAALAVIVVIAIPFFSMRQGLDDAGNDPPSSTTRQAYDLLTQAFGPGYNGPLQLVAEVHSPGDESRFAAYIAAVKHEPGVAPVQPAQAIRTSPNGLAQVAIIYPTTSPQSAQTASLVHRVRAAIPAAEAGSTLAIHVGGTTAIGEDFAHVLSEKMPQFVAVVVILAFLLLAAVFRSLIVPLVASIMNLLSIGAALGVLTAAFQWGWGKSLLGYSEAGPIEAFLPVMLFSILFGLSMDYEVFLVSRMHEEWVLSGDNDQAVTRGQAETGRVITAAALIMILVFVSFIFGGQLIIKEFGLGFAGAIFIDAFIIRTILVPSVMHVIGKNNWWMPGWLERLLPTVHVDTAHLQPPSSPGREEVGATT